MFEKRFLLVIGCIVMTLAWQGCATQKITPSPKVPTVVTPQPNLESHLLGLWESPGQQGRVKQMVFESGGSVKFQGGLEYFNPGRWELDPASRELKITLPRADDEHVQVFKMYLGQGVKRFDRVQKQITYAFDEQTWALNVGGWPYTKQDTAPQSAPEAEPVFK